MNPWIRFVYLLIVGIVVGAVLFSGSIAWFVTDWVWFSDRGFEDLFRTMIMARIVLGGSVGLFAGGLLFINGRIALRSDERGPVRVVLPSDVARSGLGRLLTSMPLTRPLFVVSAVMGFFSGLIASGWWDEILLAVEGTDFGYIDPILGFDAGFYVFTMPMLSVTRSLLVGIVVLAVAMAGGIYFMREAIRVEFAEVRPGQYLIRGLTVEQGTRRHLAVLVFALGCLVGAGAWLRRFDVITNQTDRIAGPGFADIYATLPLLGIEAVATVLGAAILAWAVLQLRRVPAFVGGGLIALSWGLSALVPGLVWRLQVEPNELVAEAPYIEYNMAATRFAFDLDDVELAELQGDTNLGMAEIEANQPTIRNVRLWDHEPLLLTFAEVQEIATYYEFANVDNDRYMINGELRQTMLSPRELFTSAVPDQSWVNTTMTYTHGYGVALGPVNEVSPEGLPKLFVQDLPPQISVPDDLRIDRPEIYFGEAPDSPVFVRTDTPEFDYPLGAERVFNEYGGKGGISIGGMVMRALVAIRLGAIQLLLADDIRADSQVLLYRNVVQRVDRIAPFLSYDSDPYMVVHEGRQLWVLEGYTRTRKFPYSQEYRDGGRTGLGNYLRNSVKVVVDAYDGDVTFYRMPVEDPIADAWASIFPNLFRPIEEMPETLRAHLRYPQLLFRVQAHMFRTYHMTDAQVFYSNEDAWEIPAVGGSQMQPYYTVMKLPGEETEEFILMLPFNRLSKENLAAWMVARSDGEHYGKLRVYGFPKDKLVYGPNQMIARFDQNDEISEKVSLWNQQGSEVDRGTLLVIPIEESLIYIQPLYLKAKTGSIPELKRVIVGYENTVVMEQNLELALSKLFGGKTSTVVHPEGTGDLVDPVDPVDPADPSALPVVVFPVDWHEAATRASSTWRQTEAAAKDGDWSQYGQLLDQLGADLKALERLNAEVPALPELADPAPLETEPTE
jgi:uncharacterized protein